MEVSTTRKRLLPKPQPEKVAERRRVAQLYQPCVAVYIVLRPFCGGLSLGGYDIHDIPMPYTVDVKRTIIEFSLKC